MLEVQTKKQAGRHGSRLTFPHYFVVNPETGITVGSFSQLWNAWDCAVWKPFLDAGQLPIVAPSGLFEDDRGPGGKIGYTSDPTQGVRTRPLATATADQVHSARLAVRKFIHAHTSTNNAEVFTMSDTDYFEHDPAQYEADLIQLTEGESGEPTPEEDAAAVAFADEDFDAQAEAWALAQEAAEAEPEPEELPHDAQPPSAKLPDAPEETPEPPAEPSPADDGVVTPEDAREAAREALSDSDRNAFDNYAELAEDAPEHAREFWQRMADDILKGEA